MLKKKLSHHNNQTDRQTVNSKAIKQTDKTAGWDTQNEAGHKTRKVQHKQKFIQTKSWKKILIILVVNSKKKEMA